MMIHNILCFLFHIIVNSFLKSNYCVNVCKHTKYIFAMSAVSSFVIVRLSFLTRLFKLMLYLQKKRVTEPALKQQIM